MSLEFDKMCRTCLCSGSALLSIFESKSNQFLNSTTPSIAFMIKSITSVDVIQADGLPEKVCLACISEINRAFSFKIKCENSDNTLKQYLIQHSDVVMKNESAEKCIKVDYDQTETSNIDEKETGVLIVSDTEDNQKDCMNDDDMSFILSAEVYDQEDQNACEGSEREVFSIDTLHEEDENDNLDQAEELQAMEGLILECGHCGKKLNCNETFQCHVAQCIVENEKTYLKDDETSPTEVKKGRVTDRNEKVNNDRREKIRKRSGRVSLKCPHCPVDFVHLKNLEKHIRKYHGQATSVSPQTSQQDDELSVDEDEDAVEARKIDSEVINMAEEVKHEPAELPESKYKCMQCGAGFAKEKSLNYHFKMNRCTEKQFECLVCRRVFITKKNLFHHMKEHSKFECGKCAKVFSRKDKLKVHNDIDHKGVIKNQCPYCQKVFTMLSTLKDHLRTHSGEKPFLCSICGKGFSQSTNLKQHLMRHAKTKPYKCDLCGNSFVSKGELNAHIRKHTGDHPFICSTCGAGFTTSSSLVKHRRIHTGERPYACEFCPMRFSALGTLKNHRRTHTGEKPFICQYCERSFAQKSDCVTHERTHTGERPYMCTICGLSFVKSSAMKVHVLSHDREGVDSSGSGESSRQGKDTEDTMDLNVEVFENTNELQQSILQR